MSDAEYTALSDAVTAAQSALAAKEVLAQISATPANVAAVQALSDRLVAAEQALNDYLALESAPPINVITTPTVGISGPQPTLPPPVTTPIPNPAPSGADVLSSAQIAALIAAEVVGGDEAVGTFIDGNATPPTVEDAWDYFVQQIDEVFTGLEGSFDGLAATAVDVSVSVEVAEVAAGVTADIGGIEVIGFGVALLLGEYVTGWIIQQVGAVFPDPKIFGWQPLNFIKEGITSLGNQLAGAAENEAEYVVNFITQPIRMLTGLFQRIFNAHATTHNKIATVVTTTIPNATAGLLTSAENYTDTKLSANLVQAEDYADTLRTDLESEIATAKADAENAALNDAQNVQQNLINRLQGDETTLAALSTEVTVTIPNEVEAEINESVATENAALTAQLTPIQTEIAQLQQQVQNEQSNIAASNAAISAANANIQTLQSAENVDDDAIASEQQTIATAQADIATSTTAISDLYTQITSISSTLAPIQAAQQLNTSTLNEITPIVEVGLPTALAALSTKLTNLQTDVDECMVDNCDTANPNNIQNVLRDLLGLLTAAAEIGFIAEAIKDPIGTANALSPLLEGIDTSATDTLNLLLDL